ncbi:MAG: hypothetical protein U0792_03490 [Gemmataceae bacterium]
MFFALAALVFFVTLTAGQRGGPRRAVAVGWVGAAFLVPYWLQYGVGSMLIDLRTVAMCAVVILLISSPPKNTFRLTLADLLVIFLVLVQVVSQYHAGSFRPLTLPEICRKWVGPYLMGRTLLGSTDDIRDNISGIAKVIAVLTVLAVAECFLQINFVNKALGRTFSLLEAGEGYRWGLKRAHVTFDHPIFFGMGLVLLLPWAIEAARLAREGQGPAWWKYLPWAMAAALFSTVSRGPQIAGIATAGIYLFFRIPRLRIPFALVAICGGLMITAFKEELVDLLAVVAGEKSAEAEVRIIKIDGEDVEYTGTNHRVLLFRVYADAIDKAGFFGSGSELKGVEVEEHLSQRFSSIDCHYLLFYLQHGKAAIAAFLILTAGILLILGRLAFRRDLQQSALAAGLFGALLSVAVLLVSVWFSPDFSAIWLFSAGLAGRLHLLGQSKLVEKIDNAAAPARLAEPSSPPARIRPIRHPANLDGVVLAGLTPQRPLDAASTRPKTLTPMRTQPEAALPAEEAQ